MQLIARIHRLDFITTVVFTFLGILFSEITVFYLIYLFWLQEFIRTVFDSFLIFKKRKDDSSSKAEGSQIFGSYFLMFIYFIFIVVIFGFITASKESNMIFENMRVLFFGNVFFNLNILFFIIEYYFHVKNNKTYTPKVSTFNSRHIILHVSIIIGAFIQMFFLVKFEIDGALGSALVATPFLLLKYFFDRPFGDKKIQQT